MSTSRSGLQPNTDPLTITLPVNVAEAVAYALKSFVDSNGIPLDDPSEHCAVGLHAINAALSSVPFVTLSASVGPAEPAFPEPVAQRTAAHIQADLEHMTRMLAEARQERDALKVALAESVAARDAAERSCDAAVERADRADRVAAELRRDLEGAMRSLRLALHGGGSK